MNVESDVVKHVTCGIICVCVFFVYLCFLFGGQVTWLPFSWGVEERGGNRSCHAAEGKVDLFQVISWAMNKYKVDVTVVGYLTKVLLFFILCVCVYLVSRCYGVSLSKRNNYAFSKSK